MTTTTFKGYTETDYLSDSYMGGQAQAATGMQANMVIKGQKTTGMQASMAVGAQKNVGMQASMTVTTSSSRGMQALMSIIKEVALGMQAQMQESGSPATGMQATQHINTATPAGMQALMKVSTELAKGMQAYMHIVNTGGVGMEAKQGKLRSAIQQVYLEYGYLEGEYLAESIAAFLGMQANMITKHTAPTGMQARQVINKQNNVGMQATMIVHKQTPVGMQANMVRRLTIGMQATQVIYNVTQLRIMDVFPSRGTAGLGGNNWTASSTASGDFSVNNLNTDIVEQVYRSNGSPSLITLVCNTGLSQGVPLDTIAILGHNLTKSATVTVQGSMDPLFGSINVSFVMSTELNNMYYIAPSFPNQAGQNQYWRFVIQDATNPDGYIQIGTLLFGASHIFSVAESFVNPITRGFKHFKDELKTEGFTSANNDRALKKFIKLKFEKLNYFNGNYTLLDDMMQFARTSLKVLVIPTPEFPSRYAIFGKLTQMPEITHTSIDPITEYVDLDIEWDESL